VAGRHVALEGGCTLKRIIAAGAGCAAILAAVFLFNRWVLSVSSGYMDENRFHNAHITAQAVIPFDPFLYIPSSVYREHMSEIRTRESIRRFSLFHPMQDETTADIGFLDDHIYGNFRGYDFSELWNRYTDIIRAFEAEEHEKVPELYSGFFAHLKKDVPAQKKGLIQQMAMFHTDYMRRLHKKGDILENISFNMEKFSETGSDRYIRDIINLLRDFDVMFELRYKEDQPLHYVHSTLMRNTVLFQAHAVNYLNNKNRDKLVEIYDSTLKPVVRRGHW